jgi:tetratricopeptide (TPR) repeat protein
MTDDGEETTDHRIDEVFALVMTLDGRRPAAELPRRLDALFRDLVRAEPVRPADETLDLVWALWISHPDEEAAAAMAAAVEAMAAEEFDIAGAVLDELVVRHPRWAEAWNKRATLAFVEERDAEALFGIEQTLLLEPRHFGAISGFGQICLRHARWPEAKAAFQVALALNPHLQGLREAIAEIDGSTDGTKFH